LTRIEAIESAQSGEQDVTLGAITCRGLTVDDGEGKKSVVLSNNSYGGLMALFNKGGETILHAIVTDDFGA